MKTFLLIPLLLFTSLLFAGNTNISAIVNSYAPVTAIGSNNVTIGTVSPAHTFVCGDRVLIIQMQGADIITANNANFGNVTGTGANINNAGKYEMATVSRYTGGVITFTANLINTYTVAGKVQVVYVPHYDDATVTAKLTAQAWDGSTGGVLSIEVDGTLTLNADIDADTLGFRGGEPVPSGTVGYQCGLPANGCQGLDYSYNSTSNRAAGKGEGIALYNNTYLRGKGKNANGGGGGGLDSGGGGGGSNYGAGGRGGACNNKSCFNPIIGSCPKCTNNGTDVSGIGGLSLTNNDRLFFGGGGGSGNGGNSSQYYVGPNINGERGGGIIIISANSIVGNNKNISANGENGITSSTVGSMGTGGGGAGGSIHLLASKYTSLKVNAIGGKGNDSRKVSGSADNTGGAGGGGGGGRVLFNNASAPAGVTVNVTLGVAGVTYDKEGDVRGAPLAATNGANGTKFYSKGITENVYRPATLNASTASETYTVSENRPTHFYNNGSLVAIKSNTNNLGVTTVTSTVGSSGPFASTGCSTNELYVARVIDIVPTTQPTTACTVSLFMTDADLTDFIALTNAQNAAYKSCWGAVNSINDLIVTVVHGDGSYESIAPTVSSVPCTNIYQLDVEVSKFSTFYIHSNKGSGAANPLPVEWLKFDAEYISKDEVELEWATATEINNEGYYVERSYDGENFEEINFVKGKGNYNAKTDYRFIDKIDAYSGFSNVYYRLRQVDYNGEFEYSKIRVLKLEVYNFVGEIYPNPTYGSASIEVINNSEAFCYIKMYNSLGKLVYEKKEETNSKGMSKLDIEIKDLDLGIYICVIEINGERTVRRLIKR